MNGRLVSIISSVPFLLIVRVGHAQSSTPREETCVTDGAVWAIARTANTVYIGGDFTYVGPYTGGFVPISAATGRAVAVFPKVNGSVYACVPDGAGGWFIGGELTKIGGVARNNIAHIRADGSVDTAWNPNANDRVYALAVSGTIVYAGGEFTTIGGQSRNCIAALDASTGQPTAWNPNANSGVVALAASGTTVYAGGYFWSIGGQRRHNFAQFDPLPPTAVNASLWPLY